MLSITIVLNNKVRMKVVRGLNFFKSTIKQKVNTRIKSQVRIAA